MLSEIMEERDQAGYSPSEREKIKRDLRVRKRPKFKKRLREEAEVKPRDEIPIHESETGLCVALWRSVVMQAIYDISGRGGSVERKIIRAEAMSWFFQATEAGMSTDFEYVCDLANLRASDVLKLVKELRESGQEFVEGLNFRTVRRKYLTREVKRINKPRVFRDICEISAI